MSKRGIDQLGAEVVLPSFPPQRVVSLVPSITELLFDLGLNSRISGVTWFCVHPAEEVKQKARVGGTKKLKLDRIKKLSPDLIVGNKEENRKEDIGALKKDHPVWISDVQDLETAVDMIKKLGELVGKDHRAGQMAEEIMEGFEKLPKTTPANTLYLIWRKPYMAAGGDTFIHDMMSRCGLVNLLGDHKRYPELNEAKIRKLDPQLVLLSSEPYPFKERHVKPFREIVPQAKVMLVDGQMFSWYGSRLLKAVQYLEDFCNKWKVS